jgi:DNA (cytosine-5)-methyltransferase 1
MNVERNTIRETFPVSAAGDAMGIDWMVMSGLSQAVPPAYTEFIGRQLIRVARG